MEKIPSIKFWKYTEEDEIEVELNCVYEVCYQCQGKGKMVNPAIDGHGLTREDFNENPGFYEDYMDGVYDIPCPECKGKRVVPVPCRYTNSKEDLEAYDKHMQEEADYEALCRMERMMGC